MRGQAKRGSWWLALWAATAVASGVPNNAAAQNFGNLDLVVDRPIFEKVCDHLQLTESQRKLAEALWLEYVADVEALVRLLEKDVDDAGLRESRRLHEEARSRNEAPPWDRISVLMAEVKKLWVDGLRRSDEYLRLWLENIRAILTEEQIGLYESIEPLIRRLSVEERRRAGPYGRFIGNVSIHRLIETGLSPDQTFYEWLCAVSPNEPPALEEFEGRLSEVMARYELLLDNLMMRRIARSRREPDRDYSVFIGDDREFQSRRIARLRLSLNTARQIEMLVSELFGYEGAAAWSDRFSRTIAPFLYYQYIPEYVYHSIQRMEGIDPTRLQQIEAIHRMYQTRLAIWRRQAMSLGLATEFALMAADREDLANGLLPVHVRFAKLLHRMRELMLATAQQMASVLPEDDRKRIEALIFDSQAYDPQHHLPSWNHLEEEAALGVDLPDPVILRPEKSLHDKETSK